MKNFLLGLLYFLLILLINALYIYVLVPIFIVGIMSWLWMPLLFEFEGAFIIGIVITILTSVLTSVVIGIFDYKLESY